jgi:hypothetical protein
MSHVHAAVGLVEKIREKNHRDQLSVALELLVSFFRPIRLGMAARLSEGSEKRSGKVLIINIAV